MDFLLLNVIFKFHTTLCSKHIANSMTILTVRIIFLYEAENLWLQNCLDFNLTRVLDSLL